MINPMTGDLIFVKPVDSVGRFVARVTNGPFCHVRIVASYLSDIEANAFHGVSSYYGTFKPGMEEIAQTGAGLDPDRVIHAQNWLMSQRNQPYSWWDIAADGIKLLLPRWLGSPTPFLIAPSQYDCSALATQFLVLAGYQWLPDELATNPAQVSPNDLARAVGLLK